MMGARLDSLFVRVSRWIEEHPAPLGRFVELFGALLVLRLGLEFFSSHRLFTFNDVLHIALWFVFIVLAFLLQLHLFSGSAVQRVSRLVAVCYVGSWSAPLLDLLLTGGQGAKMNYLSLNSAADVLRAYLTVGGPGLLRGATIGIRIEIVLLVLASANYVRLKTGSLPRAVAAGWSIYTVLFVSGAVPALLVSINRALGLQFEHGDQSTVLLLASVDLGLLAVLAWRSDPTLARRLVASARWSQALLLVGFGLVGLALARQAYVGALTLTPTTLYWPVLLASTGVCLALWVAANELPEARGARSALFALALGSAALISARAGFMATALWGVFALTSAPLELGRVPVLRELTHAMAAVCAALLGFVIGGGPMVGFPAPWLFSLLALAFVGSGARRLVASRA